MPKLIAYAAVILVVVTGGALASREDQRGPATRDADTKAIRHEIERIFQAFIDKDRQALVDTHIENWRGYLTGSRTLVKGRDAYMMQSVGPGPMGPRGQGMVGYDITEYDTVYYGDTAVVSFVANIHSQFGKVKSTNTLTLIDVFVKERGRWIQAASQTSLHPDSQQAHMSELRTLDADQREDLFKSREAVWRAWYAGDRGALMQLLPPELIALGESGDSFGSRDAIIGASEAFAKSGGKLRRLEFPRTDIQAYGNTAIIYTTYALETEMGGKVEKESGKATEMFVWRDGRWQNNGWQLAPAK